MIVTCKNCGGQHPVWECREPLKESTAPHSVGVQPATEGASSILAAVDTTTAPAAKRNRNAYSATYMRDVYRPNLRARKALTVNQPVNTDTVVNDG